jgi:hypothetical protein
MAGGFTQQNSDFAAAQIGREPTQGSCSSPTSWDRRTPLS